MLGARFFFFRRHFSACRTRVGSTEHGIGCDLGVTLFYRITAPHIQSYVRNVTPAQMGSRHSCALSTHCPQLSRAGLLTVVFCAHAPWREGKHASEERTTYLSGTRTLAPDISTAHVSVLHGSCQGTAPISSAMRSVVRISIVHDFTSVRSTHNSAPVLHRLAYL